MSQTGNIGNVNAGNAYTVSFGILPSGTEYVNHFKSRAVFGHNDAFKSGVDFRPELHKLAGIGLKALSTTTGGTGTAGQAMIPVYLDPQIVDLTRKETPLVELIPRVTNLGLTADYVQITAKGGAFSAGEDASLSETNTTTARQSTSIKYLYSKGRVTGQAIASYPSFLLMGMMPQGGAISPFVDQFANNAKQFEILVKTRELRELEEGMIVNGNATTTGVSGNTGANGTEYNGFVQIIGTTNKVDKNTTALSLDDINTGVQEAYDDGGRPNLAVCSTAVFTDLLSLLTAKIGYLQSTSQVFWGFSTIVLKTMVGDIPVIPSRYLSNTSGSKSIYFLDMSVTEMRVLQDVTFKQLADTNDSEPFVLKIYECLIIRAPQFCSWIGEIA